MASKTVVIIHGFLLKWEIVRNDWQLVFVQASLKQRTL